MINSQLVRQLQKEMKVACEAIAKRHNLDLRAAGGSIGMDKAILRFELVDPTLKQAALASEGLDNKEFTFRGRRYKVVDFVPSRPRFPVVAARQPDGKRFKFPMSVVVTFTGPFQKAAES